MGAGVGAFANLLSAPQTSASLLPFPSDHQAMLGGRSAASAFPAPTEQSSALPAQLQMQHGGAGGAGSASSVLIIQSPTLVESTEQWERDAVRQQPPPTTHQQATYAASLRLH